MGITVGRDQPAVLQSSGTDPRHHGYYGQWDQPWVITVIRDQPETSWVLRSLGPTLGYYSYQGPTRNVMGITVNGTNPGVSQSSGTDPKLDGYYGQRGPTRVLQSSRTDPQPHGYYGQKGPTRLYYSHQGQTRNVKGITVNRDKPGALRSARTNPLFTAVVCRSKRGAGTCHSVTLSPELHGPASAPGRLPWQWSFMTSISSASNAGTGQDQRAIAFLPLSSQN